MKKNEPKIYSVRVKIRCKICGYKRTEYARGYCKQCFIKTFQLKLF